MGGNKGGCAIRLEFSNTRICFVTAHLAAGFSNYDERNRDYETISHGLRFQKNRSIEDHDTIIWMGDFNYRIGLDDNKVRRLTQQGDFITLYENDQVILKAPVNYRNLVSDQTSSIFKWSLASHFHTILNPGYLSLLPTSTTMAQTNTILRKVIPHLSI